MRIERGVEIYNSESESLACGSLTKQKAPRWALLDGRTRRRQINNLQPKRRALEAIEHTHLLQSDHVDACALPPQGTRAAGGSHF